MMKLSENRDQHQDLLLHHDQRGQCIVTWWLPNIDNVTSMCICRLKKNYGQGMTTRLLYKQKHDQLLACTPVFV